MNGLDKNFAAPHTGIVLSIADLIAPVIYTLATVLMGATRLLLTVLAYVILPTKKVETGAEPMTTAPHVALITVPGNFVTGAFKSW